MPEVRGVLETAVYVEDVKRSKEFYTSIFNWKVMQEDSRFCALNVSPGQVFLLFRKRATLDPVSLPGGVIPPHDGNGHLHAAFAVDSDELHAWKKWLEEKGIPIESHVKWPRGGQSVYFRDPDGHLLELATPGIWENY